MEQLIAGRYRLDGQLGTGGSSQVFRAYDQVALRPVALKILDRGAAADRGLRDAFVKEARALAALSHPNIVRILGGGDTEGVPFIVMELVEGPSLAERLQRGPLSLGEASRIATQIASALAFAHAQGIVHGDLKPANVLLTHDDTAKLTDFGLTRTLVASGATQQLFATAQYVAPERVEGKPAGPAADVYGLGLVLYEMLIGRPPFESEQADVLIRDHLLRTPVPPSHLRPSLPRKTDEVVLRALAKRPELRYLRMTDFATAIERLTASSSRVMTLPIADFVPLVAESPVVAMLSRHGGPIRRTFFGLLTALPLAVLAYLAGAGTLGALLGAGFVALLALAGQLGVALALAWIVETALVFLFVPGLAVLFGLLGLWVWLRDVSPERAALALAMPVAAPFGLAPALVFSASAVFGLAGMAVTAFGAVLTVLVGIATGRPSYGPFAQTGLPIERDSLFDLGDASGTEAAFAALLRSSEDRFGPLRDQLDPGNLAAQVGDLVSRVSGADVALSATVLAWSAAALTVWSVTRVLRTFFDALLRRRTAWFGLYVFATAAGVGAGAALLYLVFATWSPLVRAAGRPGEDALLASAVGGALVALAIRVVIAAVERREPESDPLPPLGGGRIR